MSHPSFYSDRLVVTAFDTQYFRQGLNLIASLHRTSLPAVERILVYSLGLTDVQRDRLNLLERVDVVDFPPETQTFYPEYLHPKSHAFKCAAIKFAADHVAEGGRVLWMDAGIAALRSVGEIFEHIARDGIFFVDHSDSGFWPFYNLMFTHPRSLVRMEATSREMMGLHLCSCILGYTKNGAYQQLIEEAYVYSQDSEVVLWPKHSGAAKNEDQTPSPWQRIRKKAILKIPNMAEWTSRKTLQRLFGYYGHTGDQPIYSVLRARYGGPLHPAPRYNRSNRLSERASKLNWHSGGESDALLRSRYNLEMVDDEVVIYHHRGTYDNLDGLQFKHRQTGTILLRGALVAEQALAMPPCDTMSVDLSPDDLHAQGWIPTYYCWLDPPTSTDEAASIHALIQQRTGHGITLFFLHPDLLQTYPDLADEPDVFFPHHETAAFSLLDHPPAPAPVLAVQCALVLGYRDIVVAGLEPLPEASWTALRNRLTTFPARLRHANADTTTPPLSLTSSSNQDAPPDDAEGRRETDYWRARVRDGLPLSRHFSRSEHTQFDELGFVRRMLDDQTVHNTGTMIDVGACHGHSLRPFAEAGWHVLAFEPDANNRAVLERQTCAFSTVHIDARAISDQEQEQVPFYASEESTGVSSLLAFTKTHVPTNPVSVTTLGRVLEEYACEHVTLLKIDAEGYDLPVLRGFPWHRMRPTVVVSEFEDSKTKQIGYDYYDLAGFLYDHGYHVLVSEWHPVIRYGVRHDWHRLAQYPCQLGHPEAWGNLIAFATPPDDQTLRAVVQTMIKRGARPSFPAHVHMKVRRRLRRWLR